MSTNEFIALFKKESGENIFSETVDVCIDGNAEDLSAYTVSGLDNDYLPLSMASNSGQTLLNKMKRNVAQ